MNLKRKSSTSEAIAKRKEMCRKSRNTKSGLLRPVRITPDIYIRAIKLDGENFYLTSDIVVLYSDSCTPPSSFMEKIKNAITEEDNEKAQIRHLKLGSKMESWVLNWEAIKYFFLYYVPNRPYLPIREAFNQPDPFKNNVATTGGFKSTQLPVNDKNGKQNTVVPVLLASIEAGKNLHSIVRLLENGGTKALMDEGLANGINNILLERFDSKTAEKLSDCDFYDFNRITMKDIDVLTSALSNKLPANQNMLPTGGVLNSITQFVNSLTGKKLVVTFELK